MRRSVEVGELLAGRYRVDALLGRGMLGLVVAATQLSDGQRLAIKLLLGDDIEPVDRERFTREATIATRLRGVHTVRIFDVGALDDGTPFLVMELMEGEDLQHVLDREGAQPFENVVSWMLDACDALAEAHACGIVHRDLKPANLFVVKGGTRGRMLKVVDFGLSKLDDPSGRKRLTATTDVFGSPAYMAPEQLVSSARVDPRADVYSLGVTLYELLSAKLPFDAPSTAELAAQIMRDSPAPLRTHRADIPVGVEAIVNRCLEKKPGDRYQTIRELEAALVAALVDPHEAPKTLMMTHSPAAAQPPTVLSKRRTDEPARVWVLVGLGLATVVAVGSIVVAVLLRR